MSTRPIKFEESKLLKELVQAGAIKKASVHESTDDKFYLVLSGTEFEYRLRTRRSKTDRGFSSIDAAAKTLMSMGINRFETVMRVLTKEDRYGQRPLL